MGPVGKGRINLGGEERREGDGWMDGWVTFIGR